MAPEAMSEASGGLNRRRVTPSESMGVEAEKVYVRGGSMVAVGYTGCQLAARDEQSCKDYSGDDSR